MTRPPARISVEIDRLVIKGVTLGPGGAERVRQATVAALAAHLAESGLEPALAAGGAHRDLTGVAIAATLGLHTTPHAAAALGSHIGGAVGDRLGGRDTRR